TSDLAATSDLADTDSAVAPASDLSSSREDGGRLDPSFNDGGTVETSLAGTAQAIAMQPDGKIVVAGEFPTWLGSPFAIARFNPHGTLDPTFADKGVFRQHDFGCSICDDISYAVTLETDGQILAAGSTTNQDGLASMVVVRLSSDGILDSSFEWWIGNYIE